jgi:hypothetical protein
MKANQMHKPMEALTAAQSESAVSGMFATIVRGSTALGMGCMAAAVASLRSNATGFAFQFSMGTVAAFALGAAAGLVFWKLAGGSRLAARAGAALLLMAGLGGFLYPLRFVPAEHMADIAVGLTVATCAVSIGGILLWRMKRFFDEDDAAVESKRE